MANVCRIERHDVDRVYSFVPDSTVANPKFSKNWPAERLAGLTRKGKGYETTLMDQLRWAHTKNSVAPYLRKDIVLINLDIPCSCKQCGNKHARHEQRAVYPAREGELQGDGVEVLEEDDRLWALAESAKCWEVALREPLVIWWLFDGEAPPP